MRGILYKALKEILEGKPQNMNEKIFRKELIDNLVKNYNYLESQLVKELNFSPIKIKKFYKTDCKDNEWENIDWLTTFDAEFLGGISVDLAILDGKPIDTLIELKYFFPYETGKSEICNFRYLLGSNNKTFENTYDPKKTEVLENTTYGSKTQPIAKFEYNNKEIKFLLKFQEGEIWNDIVRLLSIKEQFSHCVYDTHLYLMGVIYNDNHNSPILNEQNLKDNLEKILTYLKDYRKNNHYDEYRIVSCNDDKSDDKKIKEIWINYTTLDFTYDIDIAYDSSWDYIGYIITIYPICDNKCVITCPFIKC